MIRKKRPHEVANLLRWREERRVWISGDYAITNYPPDNRFYAARHSGKFSVNLDDHRSLEAAKRACQQDAEWEKQRR